MLKIEELYYTHNCLDYCSTTSSVVCRILDYLDTIPP